MKKINLLAIGGIAFLAIALIAGVVFFIAVGNNSGAKDDAGVFSCTSLADIKNYVEENNIERYGAEQDYYYLSNISVLGQKADVEFYLNKESVKQINAYYMLFQYENKDAEVDSIESTEEYVFTDKDKKRIVERFNVVKNALEEELGCKLEQYDLIPTRNDVMLEDTDDSFYQGNTIREYSVRDKYGVLWLLRYEGSYGMANATLIKLLDETGNEGFIPSVDLTKPE